MIKNEFEDPRKWESLRAAGAVGRFQKREGELTQRYGELLTTFAHTHVLGNGRTITEMFDVRVLKIEDSAKLTVVDQKRGKEAGFACGVLIRGGEGAPSRSTIDPVAWGDKSWDDGETEASGHIPHLVGQAILSVIEKTGSTWRSYMNYSSVPEEAMYGHLKGISKSSVKVEKSEALGCWIVSPSLTNNRRGNRHVSLR